jgi:addiction module RelE/StbE family toxin
MDLHYHKNFTKAFLKLPKKMREKVKETIDIFQKDPHKSELDNHALHGKLTGKRSISVGGDMRIIFVEENNYESVELHDVGTHNQVYK